ncbi:hypothetical protein DVDV_0562 [Desulfovibrio sp. DV]|nr:hypothetical protein DVDV_0562 [Desulfovibrio sp. DV]
MRHSPDIFLRPRAFFPEAVDGFVYTNVKDTAPAIPTPALGPGGHTKKGLAT